jgi:cbb3-type cytochrome oxidase subunit 3
MMKSKWWLIALIGCLLVSVLSPLASSSPDGLERIAEDQGFSGMAVNSPFRIMTDYLFPGVPNEALATILSGLFGTLILFGLTYAITWLVLRISHRKNPPDPDGEKSRVA